MKRIGIVVACGLVASISAAQLQALELGDQAPPLKIKEWVKGKPVDLEQVRGNKVVVIEFWATWCGPCVASIPHLTDLQRKFKTEVVVVGATTEDPMNSLKKVQNFVRKQGDKMDYTVAFDEGRATARAYMDAMDISGIPTAFVIDREGRLVWVGSPFANLDEVVVQAIGGKIDLAQMKRLHQARRAMDLAMGLEDWSGALDAIDSYEDIAEPGEAELAELDWKRFECLAKNRRTRKKARPMGQRLVKQCGMAAVLNQYAWEMLTDRDYGKKFDKLALAAAEKAHELSGGDEPGIIDTLARAKFVAGDVAEAIKLQEQAVAKADKEDREIYEEALAEYQEEAGD